MEEARDVRETLSRLADKWQPFTFLDRIFSLFLLRRPAVPFISTKSANDALASIMFGQSNHPKDHMIKVEKMDEDWS